MRNLESLISEINRILDSVEKPPAGQIARLADWYSNEVEFFNESLAQILTSTDKEPNGTPNQNPIDASTVMDLYAFLNFDRLDQWKSLIASKKFPSLVDMDLASFEKVKVLHADQNQLSVLLDQYRLVVLSEAAAFARHSILLRLAQIDRSQWRDELIAFEKFRFVELERLLGKAEMDYDKALMEKAIYEIRNVQWQSTVPDSLLQFVEEKETGNYADQVEYQLGQLAKQMLLHFEAREWKKANKLKKEWKRLYALAEENAKEKMSHDIENVLDWADEEHDQSATVKKTSKVIVICATIALISATAIGAYFLLS